MCTPMRVSFDFCVFSSSRLSTSFVESDLAGLSKSLGESEEPSPLGDVKSSMVSWSKVEQTNTRGAEDEAQMNHNPIQQLMDACSDWEDPEHPISVKLRYTVRQAK